MFTDTVTIYNRYKENGQERWQRHVLTGVNWTDTVGSTVRKTGVVLLTILKWILQAALVALKLVLGIAKLFLLLLSLVMRIVLTMIGVSVGRR